MSIVFQQQVDRQSYSLECPHSSQKPESSGMKNCLCWRPPWLQILAMTFSMPCHINRCALCWLHKTLQSYPLATESLSRVTQNFIYIVSCHASSMLWPSHTFWHCIPAKQTKFQLPCDQSCLNTQYVARSWPMSQVIQKKQQQPKPVRLESTNKRKGMCCIAAPYWWKKFRHGV